VSGLSDSSGGAGPAGQVNPGAELRLLIAELAERAASAHAECVGELGLTAVQVAVLEMVAQRAGLSQQALAWRVGLAPSRINKLIDELEALDMLERRVTRADRRKRRLHVTTAGQERIDAARIARAAYDAQMAEKLTREELAIALVLLRKLGSDVLL
jgi:DNA-binding MarR family transcriptional regulator